MPAERLCTECGGPLIGKATSAYTCSDSCRKKRQRRRAAKNAEAKQRDATVSQIVRSEVRDVATDVLKAELAPVVREALDDDVLRAVRGMVALTPRAVQVLGEQLDSEDQVLAGRAASLVVKYTVGHPALVRPQDEAAQPMQVIFQLPRADEPSAPPALEAEAEEDDGPRRCDTCHQDKPGDAFEGGSDRCTECFERDRARILHSFQ